MDFVQILQKLGLEHKEPDVYLALLKLSGAQPASIIANRLGLNRTTVYKTLMNLATKGLVAKSQRHGITCFLAEDPEDRLKLLIERRQKQLADMNHEILEALPLIRQTETLQASMPKIRYYEGTEGIKQIYEAVLKEGKEVHRYGDISKIYEALGPFTDDYIRRRNEIGFKTCAIEPFQWKHPADLKKHANENREVLFVPQKFFPIEGEVRVFGNKVAIISLRRDSPISVLIESETVAKMFQSIFMLTWKDYSSKAIREPS